VQQKAYQAEGVNLDFYRDYNVSWNNVGIYFANPGALSCKKIETSEIEVYDT